MKTEHAEETMRNLSPEPPIELRARVLRRVGEATAQREATAQHQVSANRSGAWWRARTPLIWRFAGVTAIIGAVCIGLLLTSPGPTAPAFAQVEEAMRKIKTVHWTTTSTWTKPDGRLVYKTTSEGWTRLDPPAGAGRSLPPILGAAADEATSDEAVQLQRHVAEKRSVKDRRGRVTYYPKSNEYVINPNPIPPELDPEGKAVDNILRSEILDSVLPPDINRGVSDSTGTIKIPPFTTEYVTRGGRRLIRYYRQHNGYSTGIAKQEVLVDAETKRIVRFELQMPPSPRTKPADRMHFKIVTDQYRYDEEPPQGIFDLTPPPGARIKYMHTLNWEAPAQKPAAAELQQAQQVINRSETAWRRGDFEVFAALWDFNFDSKLIGLSPFDKKLIGVRGPAGAQRRADWQQRIQAGKARMSRLDSRIDPASARLYLSDAARHGPANNGSANNGPAKDGPAKPAVPDILSVEVLSSGAWAADGETWQDKRVPYLFRRVNGEWRIVDWQLLRLWSGRITSPLRIQQKE